MKFFIILKVNKVQVGGRNTINTIITSKEAILATCRKIVSEKGLSSLNMRAVAEACHVALGSLYNYFPSKDDLMIATIESVWQDIFHVEHRCETNLSFPEYICHLFDLVQEGTKEYPNFFTAHSLSFASSGKSKARETMRHYFSHMSMGMMEVLHSDPFVKKDAFSGGLTESDFIDFVLTNILTLLLQQKEDCRTLLEIVRRTIYAN